MEELIDKLLGIGLGAGCMLLFLSFLKRFRPNRIKFLIAGATLVLIVLLFIDWNIAYESFMRGFEACYNG